jgi:hypothetical protein
MSKKDSTLFAELSKIRWEYKSELSDSKIFSVIKEILNKDINYCLKMDPSCVKELETTFESMQSQNQFFEFIGNCILGIY